MIINRTILVVRGLVTLKSSNIKFAVELGFKVSSGF